MSNKIILASKSKVRKDILDNHKILNEVMPKIHALAIHAFTEEEFKNNTVNTNSPDCVNKNG